MKQSQGRADRVAVWLIDLLFFLGLGALAALLLFAAQPRSQGSLPLHYTVRLTVREEYAERVNPGDTVLDAVSKNRIGEVTEITVSPAMTDSYSRVDRCLRRVRYPGYLTLTLRVRADGIPVQGGYHVGRYLLYRGERMHLRLPDLVAGGTCTAISPDA